MMEIRIHGRGGQGGVTLAKLLATAHHLKGRSVQAFGLYAAERSGAPLQAFLRFDTEPITNRNLIYQPDHIVVLDPTLVSPTITTGLKPGAFILINTHRDPDEFASEEAFSSYRIATVDATSIARKHKLGTRSVPIVNTALAGAVSKLLGPGLDAVLDAFEEMGFRGANADAARQAFEEVRLTKAPKALRDAARPVINKTRTPGLVDGNTGAKPSIRTGQWAVQQPLQKESVPPCNFVCPAGNDVQGFLEALAKDEIDRALEILLATTPLPSVCGRVCPGFCMQQCNRGEFDEAVNVRALERFAGDHGSASVRPLKKRKQRVALVGSGPAGLSAAYQLARLGYGVTIFEAEEELGGLMRTGIPSYRLPADALDRDINRVLALGVKAVTGQRVDRSGLDRLKEEYDAVIVATGLQKQTTVDLGDTEGVMQGLDFLDLARRRLVDVEGKDVVVVGGGNTAIDAARSAFRLGAKSVRVVYRRTREEMPAIDEEVSDALDEGIGLDFLKAPKKIRSAGGRRVLICSRMELGEPGADGRRRPVEVPGSDFEVRCDLVLLALGQSADMTLLTEGAYDEALLTAGDLLRNEGTVTAAIGCGREVALNLHQRFDGEKLFEPKPAEDRVIRSERIKRHLFTSSRAQHEKALPISKRTGSFDEVRSGIEGLEEAKRCLSCGVCNDCDRCVTFCPDGVLRRINGELVFDYDYCKGCGVCISECPRAVIHMKAG